MFEFSALTTYVAVVLGLFLIPGPAVLLTLTRAAQSGRRAGVMTGIGIATGDLPQFVHSGAGKPFVQFLVLGLIFVLLSAIYTTLVALSIRPLMRLVRRISWIGRWQRKIVGTIFIGLGVKVALQRR